MVHRVRTEGSARDAAEYQRRWMEFARVLSKQVQGAGTLINKYAEAATVMVGLRGGIAEVRIEAKRAAKQCVDCA